MSEQVKLKPYGKTARQALRDFPTNFWRSVFRHGPTTSNRNRALVVLSNVFLHIHPVHTHKNSLRPAYTLGLGVITFILFLILCGSGIVLMFFYVPSPDVAYQRMKDLAFVVSGGSLLRNLHRWAAHGMVIFVLLHMARVFYTGSYKAPREFNWVVGILLLLLTLLLSFTGYLLPWDQLAYWAITVGSNMAGSAREVTDILGLTESMDPGGWIQKILLGGTQIGQDALIRFYVLHVAVLPTFLFLLLGVHVWRIRKDGGLSRPGEDGPAVCTGHTPEEAGGTRTYGIMAFLEGRSRALDRTPDHCILTWPRVFIIEATLFMTTLGVLILLSLFFDAPLKELANPNLPENPAKAPWYFLGLQELVSFSAFSGGLLVPAMAILGLCLIPYIDRETGGVGTWFADRNGKKQVWVSALFSAVFVIGLITFTVRSGWLRSWIPEINQLWIIAFNPGTLITLVFASRSAWVVHRTGSTRMGAISLFTMVMIGFCILTYVGTFLRGPNWEFFWSTSDWPGPTIP